MPGATSWVTAFTAFTAFAQSSCCKLRREALGWIVMAPHGGGTLFLLLGT